MPWLPGDRWGDKKPVGVFAQPRATTLTKVPVVSPCSRFRKGESGELSVVDTFSKSSALPLVEAQSRG